MLKLKLTKRQKKRLNVAVEVLKTVVVIVFGYFVWRIM